MKSATFFIMVALVNVKAHNWLKYPLSYNRNNANEKTNKLCTTQPAGYTPIVVAPEQKIDFWWSNNHNSKDFWIKMVPLNQLSKLKDPNYIYQGVSNIDNFTITVPKTPRNYVYLWGWSGFRNCVQVKVDAAVNLKPTLID